MDWAPSIKATKIALITTMEIKARKLVIGPALGKVLCGKILELALCGKSATKRAAIVEGSRSPDDPSGSGVINVASLFVAAA